MEQLAERLAEIHSIFSNAKRLLIFWALDGREMSVNEIADTVGTSVQNTSQHLRLMKARDILVSRRDGQTIYYRVAQNEIGVYCQFLYRTSVEEHFGLPRTVREQSPH